MTLKPVRQKKCRTCQETFTPFRPLQVCCSAGCAIEYAQKQRAKKELKEASKQRCEHRKAKDAIKTRAQWMKEAQAAFNRFIRLRDGDLPCISCTRHHQGQYHAGHYRTVGGNPELRFNEFNVNKQCAPCNDHLHGNIVNYRIELRKKIGTARLAWLEGPHEPKKYTIEDLKEIKAVYTLKYRELLKQRGKTC